MAALSVGVTAKIHQEWILAVTGPGGVGTGIDQVIFGFRRVEIGANGWKLDTKKGQPEMADLRYLVEAAGIEPASVSAPLKDLHA